MANYVETIDKLNAEKDVLKMKIKDFRGEKRDYQNEIYQLEKDLNDVLLDLDYERKVNQRLRDRLARLENQGDNYEIDRKNKQDEINRLTLAYQKLLMENQGLNGQVYQLKVELQGTQLKLNDLKN